MALSISKETEYGVDVTYWRITTFEVDLRARWCRIRLGGWPSEAERLADNAPLSTAPFEWDGDSFPLTGPDDPMPIASLTALLYQAIKQRPGWEAATDV